MTSTLVTDARAVFDGTHVIDTYLRDAIAACESSGGGIVQLPSGVGLLSSLITVPASVSLQGVGTAQNLGDAATVLKCTTADAGLSFVGDGGHHGAFYVNGNNIAAAPFRRVTSNSGATFEDIDVRYAAGIGVTVLLAQNDRWESVRSQNNAGHSLYLSGGCGGLTFAACSFSSSQQNNVLIDAVSPGGGYAYPTNIGFDRCQIERAQGATFAAVRHTMGEWITFRDCIVNHGNLNYSGGLLSQDDGAGGVLVIDGCLFTGPTVASGQSAVVVGSYSSHLMMIRGRNYANAVAAAMFVRANRHCHVDSAYSWDLGGGTVLNAPGSYTSGIHVG